MKNLLLRRNPLIYVILMVLVFTACKKDDTDSLAVKAGDWSGTDITFTVDENPLKISDLGFAYSGHATGNLCGFDYESTGSFETVAQIDGKSFTADLNVFNISGTFLSDTTAEIEITWTIYDSGCDANYTGSRTYSASLSSLR